MTAVRSGIPTTYRYNNMRSRLEARWAAFFDLIGWSWVYEPFDAEGWIPDFLIQGPSPTLVEIGACVSEADFLAKAKKPTGYVDLPTMILGVSPTILDDGTIPGWERAGLITNEFSHYSQGPLFWEYCGDHMAVFGDDIARPCAHPFIGSSQILDFDRFWAEAGSTVQWHR